MKRAFQAIFGTLLAWGPWGTLLLAVLDSAGIPIPVGVDALVVLTASRDAAVGYFSAALGTIGSLAGSVILYYLGRKGGEAYLDKKTQKGWARRFRRWFHHYGGLTVFIPCLVPVPLPLKIFVLSAGALGMNRAHFIMIIAGARIGRYFGLAYLGSQLGDYPLHYIKSHIVEMLAASIGLFLFLLFLAKLKDRLRQRAEARAS